MRPIAHALAVLTLAAAPSLAEDDATTAEEGLSLLEEGAKIILRSMVDEVEPALKEMQEDFGAALGEMGPALRELSGMIGDLRNYEAPERLPNGDIIIRRKAPAALLPTPGPNGEIDI